VQRADAHELSDHDASITLTRVHDDLEAITVRPPPMVRIAGAFALLIGLGFAALGSMTALRFSGAVGGLLGVKRDAGYVLVGFGIVVVVLAVMAYRGRRWAVISQLVVFGLLALTMLKNGGLAALSGVIPLAIAVLSALALSHLRRRLAPAH
jgi:hypothetical protein